MKGSITLSVMFLVIILVVGCGGGGPPTPIGSGGVSGDSISIRVTNCTWGKPKDTLANSAPALKVDVTVKNKSKMPTAIEVVVLDTFGKIRTTEGWLGSGTTVVQAGMSTGLSLSVPNVPFGQTGMQLAVRDKNWLSNRLGKIIKTVPLKNCR